MKIIIFSGPHENVKYIYNYLQKDFEILRVFVEEKPSPWKLVKSRIKKLGIFKVIGQLLFQVFSRLLNLFFSQRVSEILNDPTLKAENIPTEKLSNVENINSSEVVEAAKALGPDVIIVNGTRIIKANVIEALPKMINIHTGITPNYRGVHGAYWALVSGDTENCGVTVHEVDAGVDTGQVLAQAKITPTQRDGYITYPLLQYQAALPLLKDVLKKISANERPSVSREGQSSRLYYHPSLCEYLMGGFKKGIW